MTRAIVFVITIGLLAVQAAAQPMSRASILPGWQAADGTRMIGVRIDLDPGWKTYWRAPGGSGIPPDFDFSGSRNLAGYRVHWPQPIVFEVGGQQAIGYADSVVFPVELRLKGDAPIQVDLTLFYGVCETICVPVEDRITMRIAPSESGGDAEILASLGTVARSGAQAGVTAVRCDIAPREEGFGIRADVTFDHTPGAPRAVVFETGRDDLYISPTSVRNAGHTVQVEAEIHHWGDGALALDRSALRLTLLGRDGAVELQGCPAG